MLHSHSGMDVSCKKFMRSTSFSGLYDVLHTSSGQSGQSMQRTSNSGTSSAHLQTQNQEGWVFSRVSREFQTHPSHWEFRTYRIELSSKRRFFGRPHKLTATDPFT